MAKSDFNMFKSTQAWNISIFMGLQSLVYYSLVSWLPAVLGDYGMTGNAPGWVLFAIQIAMLPITFVGPIIANKMKGSEDYDILCLHTYVGEHVLMFAWLKSDWVYFYGYIIGIVKWFIIQSFHSVLLIAYKVQCQCY